MAFPAFPAFLAFLALPALSALAAFSALQITSFQANEYSRERPANLGYFVWQLIPHQTLPFVSYEGGRKFARFILQESIDMFKPSLVSILAVATTALLCSAPLKSRAGEQTRLVVVGSIDDIVAISHPAPEYPYDAQRMRIQGDVQVRVHVEHGRMVKVVAISQSPYLAGVSERWIRRNWQFRPSISGEYIVPISYQLST